MICELEAAPCTSGTETVTFAEIAGAIRGATLEVLSTMLSIEAEAGEAIVSKHGPPNPPGGVIALLGLTGDWCGSGQISCKAPFACRMASQMLMAEYDAVDEEVLDALAEVANMIVGNVKNIMEHRLGPMGLSTPTIVFGGEFDTRIRGNPDRVIVPFNSGGDVLTVQVVLAPQNGHTA